MSDRVLLIVESNPKNTARLSQLTEEIRAINGVFENNDQYKIVSINAARITDLSKALLKHEPEIVHFMGHGEGESGLCFHGEDGKRQLLTNTFTDEIFRLASDTVKLVFLNACYSEVQARIIARHIDDVIGMSDKIPDATAVKFAKLFYKNISLNKPVEVAFGWAKTTLGAVELPSHHVPVLLKRADHKDYQCPDDTSGKPFFDKPKAVVSKITPMSPLLVIPTSPEHKLMADKHYREVEADLEGYWGLSNSRRIGTCSSLKRELGNDSPDFVYIYTKFDDGSQRLLLDTDQDGTKTLDLETLALWFQASRLRPFLVLVLHGHFEKSMIPECLKQQTRFIWCLFTPNIVSLDDLSAVIGQFLKQSGQTKTTDLQDLIDSVTCARRLVASVTVSTERYELSVDAGAQRKAQQFRAALLRLMLGRGAIKSQLGLAIQRHLGKREILVFSVTGSELSCVFELPQQIYFAMLPSAFSQRQGVLIINWPLHIQITPEGCKDKWSVQASVLEVIGNNILHGSADISQLIQQKAEAVGISSNTGAILFHWNVSIEGQLSEDHIKRWLGEWIGIVEEKFSHLYCSDATLVHALCVKVNEQNDMGKLNQQIRRFLTAGLKNISSLTPLAQSIKPLSVLETTDIEDFFNDPEHRDWSDHFCFKQYAIDVFEFADWVIESTGGEFEDVVQALWQSQLSSYQQFLKGIMP